jgi:hypothetical protein
MKFQVKTGAASQQRTACAIVPIYSGGALTTAARSLDGAGGGLITRAMKNRDIKGEVGELLLTVPATCPASGYGWPRGQGNRRTWRKATRRPPLAPADTEAILPDHRSVCATPTGRATGRGIWLEVSYRFTAAKSKPDDKSPLKTLALPATGGPCATRSLSR